MRRGRLAGISLIVAAGFAVPTAAGAATPRQILADFAAHGRLVGHYSQADLEAALKDALVQGYGPAGTAMLRPTLQHRLRTSGTLGAAHVPPARVAGGALPFTGLDLGLIAAGGVALLLVGRGLRGLGQRE
jgi:hypothetical protein